MKNIIFLLIIALPQFLFAQKIKVESGDFSMLEGVKSFYISFDYHDMAIEDYEKEADYVEYYANKAKERGDDPEAWKEEWINNREELYQPEFITFLNEQLKSKDVMAVPVLGDLKYEINIHTIFTKPYGYKGARIDVIVTIFEIAKPENKIVISITDVRGKGYSQYTSAIQITRAYKFCGKYLGQFLAKKAY